jgi:hypothetical protein
MSKSVQVHALRVFETVGKEHRELEANINRGYRVD